MAPNDWRTHNGNELDIYHYEGATNLDLPNPYVDVYTIKQHNVTGGVDRATAIAVSWLNGHQQVWVNSLHSDVQSTWAGWAPVFTPHLVWTNDSQTSSFSAREVGMNIGESKFVYIIYGESTDKPNYRNAQLAPADGWIYLMNSAKWAGSYQYPIFRSVNVTSSYISFSDAYIVQSANFAASRDNSYLIPLYVYAL